MDIRAEKIAKARQKLKDHQEKKIIDIQKEQLENKLPAPSQEVHRNAVPLINDSVVNKNQDHSEINKIESITETNSNATELQSDVNITEILISTKTNLESQIENLNEKLNDLENRYRLEISHHNFAKQKIVALEQELSILSSKYEVAVQDATYKNGTVLELKNVVSSMKDDNNNLVEQLELTKSMLTTKEIENIQLTNKISSCQSQLDVYLLQIQQLTNNTFAQTDSNNISQERESFVKKISNLEQTIEVLQKERDQINTHYEHYVRELNKQYKSEVGKNENFAQEIQKLYDRENSLIEHISEMEIRIQNYNIIKEDTIQKQENNTKLQDQYQDAQVQLMEISAKYEVLEKQYMDSLAKIKELNEIKVKEIECNHDNISLNKLNADITSDKIAAQRATEQNRKLKSDIAELEQVIIKMGNNKLELTEMWTHENQLSKGLSLKLAEVEENVRNVLKQLKAKDEEMIRLLNENRDLERKYQSVMQLTNQSQQIDDMEKNHHHDNATCEHHNDAICHHHNTNHEEISVATSELEPLIGIKEPIMKLDITNEDIIPKQDAMSRLQERFLNIMDQVANLSDEKHRLEHIILQLQNETDTICEYVALYQQQRSLLKKREEERSNQLKIYQLECNKLKQQLEELRNLLLKFADDHEMESFLKNVQRHKDLTRVKELLEELQNCSLINPKFKDLNFTIFYPCSCCSGQIIDI